MKRILFAFCLTIPSLVISAQTDTVSIMYYNLLNFPGGYGDRVDTLEKIIRYVEPDLFLVNELQTSAGANSILNNAMNTQGVSHYSSAVFYDGFDTDNMLYYNNEKFGLLEQHQISTVTRDISEYLIYYKEPNIGSSTDTTYMWVYSCHLKAGSFQSDIDDRESEATTFKNYLQNNNRTGNLFIGGDFNFYSSTEAGCQMIINGGTVLFNDPINKLGNWNNNSFYAPYHTQCTRSSAGYAGGSSGGMDDRFDFIFVTDPVMNGSDHVQYLANSYKAIGQDGNHFNKDVNFGTNAAVPQDIATALFYNSDHLPVYMEMVIDYPVGIQEVESAISGFVIQNGILTLKMKPNTDVISKRIYSITGEEVKFESNNDNQIDINSLATGVYILNVSTNQGDTVLKFVKN
ncbi:MAG: T9SS type A sorting domain-containing protein [Flavobacteriales bacterium]|nr:T9SS type A sorting domain-containing protein [Flavobacteriales bacterium]MCB9198256.1 T9SS type A sorting domain-containing protein [Flavobacteriales bacterium]